MGDRVMTRLNLQVNGKDYQVEALEDTPLLWVLRDRLKLMGTKYGCGIGACGACLVHVDGEPTPSCMLPATDAVGKAITTIEGLSPDLSHPVQRAWIEHQVPQCGYCQSGQIMAAVALLHEHPNPSDAQIDDAMSHVLCRCGTYQRIRRGIHTAAELMKTPS
jgi:isoquinoline 1-oxidoreductase alpha subunit